MEIIELEFWRCEYDRRIEMLITDKAFDLLVKMIESTGVKVICKELPHPIPHYDHERRHKLREVLASVHAIQGLKYEEGIDAIFAIESLVAKYAAIK